MWKAGRKKAGEEEENGSWRVWLTHWYYMVQKEMYSKACDMQGERIEMHNTVLVAQYCARGALRRHAAAYPLRKDGRMDGAFRKK